MHPSLLLLWTLFLAVVSSSSISLRSHAASLFTLPIDHANQFYSGNILPSSVANQTWQLPLPSFYPSALFPGAVALKLRAAPLSDGGPLSFLVSFSQNASAPPPVPVLLTLDIADDWAEAPLGCTIAPCAPSSGGWTLSEIQGDDPKGYYLELFVDVFPFTPRGTEGEGEPASQRNKHRHILIDDELSQRKADVAVDPSDCSRGPPRGNHEINVLSLLNFSVQNQILIGNLQTTLLQSTTLFLPVLDASAAATSGVSLTAYANSLDTQTPLKMCVAYRWFPDGGAPVFANAQFVSLVNTAWTNNFVSCPLGSTSDEAEAGLSSTDATSDCSEGGFVLWSFDSAEPAPRGFDALFVIDAGTFQGASAANQKTDLPLSSSSSLSHAPLASLDCSAGFPGDGWSVVEVSPVISFNQLLVGSMWPQTLGRTAFLYRNQLDNAAAGSIGETIKGDSSGPINTSLVLTASSSDLAVALSFCAQFVDATSQLFAPTAISIPAGDWVTVRIAEGANQTGAQSGFLLWGFLGNSSAGYVVESFVDDHLFQPDDAQEG